VPLPAREPARELGADSASESSLSPVEVGELLDRPACFTRFRPDLAFGGFLRPVMPLGVPLRMPPPLDLLGTRGPALPALPVAPGVPALGVPGPMDECRARPLDAVGALLSPLLVRGPFLGTPLPGPAEDSRSLRLRIMVAAGVTGAELEP
jgi:hypothetical protein